MALRPPTGRDVENALLMRELVEGGGGGSLSVKKPTRRKDWLVLYFRDQKEEAVGGKVYMKGLKKEERGNCYHLLRNIWKALQLFQQLTFSRICGAKWPALYSPPLCDIDSFTLQDISVQQSLQLTPQTD